AATAEEMSGQAGQLQQMMSFFKTGGESARRQETAPRRQTRPDSKTISTSGVKALTAKSSLMPEFIRF
ncbi:hypothetical protein EDC35_104442, partial [Thiobaca trueperi]